MYYGDHDVDMVLRDINTVFKALPTCTVDIEFARLLVPPGPIGDTVCEMISHLLGDNRKETKTDEQLSELIPGIGLMYAIYLNGGVLNDDQYTQENESLLRSLNMYHLVNSKTNWKSGRRRHRLETAGDNLAKRLDARIHRRKTSPYSPGCLRSFECIK